MCVFSVTQLCLTLCNPKDYGMPGSSVHRSHGTFTCKNTEWVAISSSRESSRPRDPNQCLLYFLHWKQILYWGVTREVPILYIFVCVCIFTKVIIPKTVFLCIYCEVFSTFHLTWVVYKSCVKIRQLLILFPLYRRRTLNKVKKLNHIQYKIS